MGGGALRSVLSAWGLLGPTRAAASCARVGLRPTGRVGPTRSKHANPRRARCAYPPLPRERNRPPRAQARATEQHDASQSLGTCASDEQEPSARGTMGALRLSELMSGPSAQHDSNAPPARPADGGWGGLGVGAPLCERRRGGYEARARLGLAGAGFVGPTRLVGRMASYSGDASVAACRPQGHPNQARSKNDAFACPRTRRQRK